MIDHQNEAAYSEETGQWEPIVPLPYYYGLMPWAWKRLTGWRDKYGRKAHLFFPPITGW